jgi:plasmid stabilization system protein ParE
MKNNNPCILTPQAQQDILDILTYTKNTWGAEQARRYGSSLESCFKNIKKGKALTNSTFPPIHTLR